MSATMSACPESGNEGQSVSISTSRAPIAADDKTCLHDRELKLELDLEDCREENRRLHAALEQMRGEMLDLNRAVERSAMPEDLRELQLLVEDQDKRLRLAFSSLSWRITAPLRALARMAGSH